MSIRKQATFTEEEFNRAQIVADYENHAFSRFIVHCVNKETDKRYGDAMEKMSTDEYKMACGPLPGPGAELLKSIESLENEVRAIRQEWEDKLSTLDRLTGRSPDVQS